MPVRLGKREHSGFSVNPKSTIISQLLQVPMATDLASGEKTSWFGWKESLWISILSMPSHIPWWKAKYPKLLVSQVFFVVSTWKGPKISHYNSQGSIHSMWNFHITFSEQNESPSVHAVSSFSLEFRFSSIRKESLEAWQDPNHHVRNIRWIQGVFEVFHSLNASVDLWTMN